ncbi:MAG: hypothetical protein K2X81_04920, partial [Candidatus Obscuribacterales bacterium]|nr:hypothetical protein [Candidatus Obscuribacterales bacterium]
MLYISSSNATIKKCKEDSGTTFAIWFTLLILLSAVFSGCMPGTFTIATVVVFGGPHNWFEFRYFLSRLPSRFGPLFPFFITAFGGVLLLGAMEIMLMFLSHQHLVSGEQTLV